MASGDVGIPVRAYCYVDGTGAQQSASGSQLREKWGRNEVTPDTLVWIEGMPTWMPLRDVSDLFEYLDSIDASAPSMERRTTFEGQTAVAMAGVRFARMRQLQRGRSSVTFSTFFQVHGLEQIGEKLEEHGFTSIEDVRELSREDLINTLQISEADAEKLVHLISQH
jgi:hypothetical protein